jgi:hypothetical protein
LATSASAFTEGFSPQGICAAEQFGIHQREQETKLLEPIEGTVVPEGATVTFSAESAGVAPPTFMVASSPALISTPDVDSAPGTAEGGNRYSFTSLRAANRAGTVYWAVSWAIPGCEGLPVTYTTSSLPLTVVPPLQMDIQGPVSVSSRNPFVSLLIHCTAACSGHVQAQAWIGRRRRKTVRVHGLDFPPATVSVASATGGDQRLTYSYSGFRLRRLRRIFDEGGAVEVRVSAEGTGLGGAAKARRVLWLLN